ncbi:MAG: FAD-binding oxidoreductase, partial [Clostridia bacterium]
MEKQLKSVWQRSDDLQYKSIDDNMACDVVVIGGGLVGQLSAYFLSEKGYDVTLVEAKRIMSGTTVKTTATITSQQGMIYGDIAKKYGLDIARKYWQAQEDGIAQYLALIEKHSIQCDFQLVDGYFFTQKRDISSFTSELETLRNIGAELEFMPSIPQLPFEVTAAVKQKNQAQFDVIKFLSKLPREYTIFENSRVTKLDLKNCIAYANGFKISAQKIVVATQYPIINKCNLLLSKMYQSMTYASAFVGCDDIGGIFNDDNEDGITLRNFNNMLIVGGADHRTGRKEENCLDKLEVVAKKMSKDARLVTSWLGEDVATYDHMPLVGRLKKHGGNVLVATGFNKWGMSNAIASANLVCDLVCEKQNKYQKVFDLHRKYRLHNMKCCIKNMSVAIARMTKSWCYYPL